MRSWGLFYLFISNSTYGYEVLVSINVLLCDSTGSSFFIVTLQAVLIIFVCFLSFCTKCITKEGRRSSVLAAARFCSASPTSCCAKTRSGCVCLHAVHICVHKPGQLLHFREEGSAFCSSGCCSFWRSEMWPHMCCFCSFFLSNAKTHKWVDTLKNSKLSWLQYSIFICAAARAGCWHLVFHVRRGVQAALCPCTQLPCGRCPLPPGATGSAGREGLCCFLQPWEPLPSSTSHPHSCCVCYCAHLFLFVHKK